MPDRKTAREIEDVAIDWAVRAERGMTAEEQSGFDIWLAQDSRHLGAFVQAQAAWIHAERAGALGKMPEGRMAPAELEIAQNPEPSAPEKPAPPMLSRRMMVGGGSAIAASVAASSFLGFERYRTLESGVGEIRHIALAGGTMLTLDTDTRVDIARSSQDRRLELVRGKLFLEVARSGAGSFSVKAGDLLAEMVQGAFGFEALASAPITALVTSGRLMVSQGQGLFAERIRRMIGPGQQLRLSAKGDLASAQVQPFGAADRERLLAWRDGMLSFGGEALADAALGFRRYSALRIVVSDPQLARQRVTGLFKANDPKGFADAVAASFGGVVSLQGEVIRIAAEKMPSG
jgi:transmembrane sensor